MPFVTSSLSFPFHSPHLCVLTFVREMPEAEEKPKREPREDLTERAFLEAAVEQSCKRS